MMEPGVLEYFNVEPALFKRRGPTVSLVEQVEERWIMPRLALHQTDRVLDFACGLGRWTRLIHPKVRQVVAIDGAPRLMNALKKRRLKNVLAMQGSHEQLRRFDGHFDKVIFAQSLEFFRKDATLFKKFYRALKPGGRLFLSTWTPALIKGAARIRVDKDAVDVRRLRDARPIRVFCRFRTKAQLHQAMANAGFKAVAVEMLRIRSNRLPMPVKRLFGRKFDGPDRQVAVLIVAVAEKPRF